MKQTYYTGLAGEHAAARWLQSQRGMKLLETRYRTKAGEIDLILLDGDTVVFAEVKTRMKAEAGDGLKYVDSRKQQRIAKASVLYLLARNWLNRSVRYDIVEVSGDRVMHIANAFQPSGMFYR